jgi:hypothetical protein
VSIAFERFNGLTVCCKWRYLSVAVVIRRDGGLSLILLYCNDNNDNNNNNIIIIIIIMKSSFNRDNNYCHYVIQRIAGFAITLYYHPTELIIIVEVEAEGAEAPALLLLL